MNQRVESYLVALLPGTLISLVACTVAGLLGGPIALAIAGFLGASSWGIYALLSLMLLRFYRSGTALRAFLWGVGLYLASLLAIAGALTAWGPSQIM